MIHYPTDVSKNKRKRKGGYKPNAPPSTTDVVDEITQLASEISKVEEAGPLWGQLHKVFLKSTVDAGVAAAIIMHRNEEELAKVISQLQHGEQATVQVETLKRDAPLPEIPFETKKLAMRMFRKRVKFIKLDRESKLGIGPLTTGREATFDSIEAPHDYPQEVWKVLANEGQLIDDGGGFYRLP